MASTTGERIRRVPDTAGDTYFRAYPLEKEFTHPTVRFYIVPEGHEVVYLKMGKNPISKGSGLRFMIGLNGLYESAFVVNTQMQTEDLEAQNLITNNGVELPRVDGTLNYTVTDSVKAFTKIQDYRRTSFELAKKRIREEVTLNTLENLLNMKRNKRNLAKGEKYEDLEKSGVEWDSLYITEVDIPEELRKELAYSAIAKELADAKLIEAQVEEKVAESLAKAAKIYETNPGAFDIKKLETYLKMSKNESTTMFMGEILSNLEKLINQAKSI